jgi:archaeal type IV pilus assembly protein PilA
MTMKRMNLSNEVAVSPVVGVMLMLVVVIIIAAVVSGFAGSLVGSEKKAPQMTAEATIVNTGYYYGSQFTMLVTGVSEPIPSKDVIIKTSWKASNGVKNSTTVLPGAFNWNYGNPTSPNNGTAPWANGPGIKSFGMYNTKTGDQYFGNYTITSGTSIRAYPSGAWGPTSVPATYGGYGPGPDATYVYADTTVADGYHVATDVDAMQAVFGMNWNNLRPGDVVNLKIIHTPSGKIIFEQDISVRGN